MEVLLHSAERKRYFTSRCDLENAVLVSFPLHTLHTSVYYYQLTVLQISATLSLGGSIGIGSIDLVVNQLGLPILSLRRPIHLIRGQLKQRLNLKIYSPLTAILLTGGVCVGGGSTVWALIVPGKHTTHSAAVLRTNPALEVLSLQQEGVNLSGHSMKYILCWSLLRKKKKKKRTLCKS